MHQASRCVRLAKLVTLQLHFLNQGSALRLVNLQAADMMDAAMALPRCYQVGEHHPDLNMSHEMGC